jgi:hypothetical protein
MVRCLDTASLFNLVLYSLGVTQQPNDILDDDGDDDDDDKEGCVLLVIALRRCNHHEKHGTLQSHSWRPCFLLDISQVWRSDS